MKTGDLIRALAADSEVHPMPPGRALALALIPGVAIALGLISRSSGSAGSLTLLGELASVQALPHLLAGRPFRPLVSRIARPGADTPHRFMLAIVPALLRPQSGGTPRCSAAEWGQRLVALMRSSA